MYKFRYVPGEGEARPSWEGNCQTPAQALEQGRNRYGEAGAIDVAEVRPMTFSELVPNASVLFSILQDRAHAISPDDDEISNAFDLLPAGHKELVRSLIVELIEEWEADLSEEQKLQSVVVLRAVRFWAGAVIRGSEFS